MGVSVFEWNGLSNNERNERCKKFVQIVESGLPFSLGDMRKLAEECETPIPRMDNESNLDFNGYDIG